MMTTYFHILSVFFYIFERLIKHIAIVKETPEKKNNQQLYFTWQAFDKYNKIKKAFVSSAWTVYITDVNYLFE